LEEAARRYPSDPEIWYNLGEYRNHLDPPLGGIPGPALQAFERAIALDPGFAPAYEHVVALSMSLGRPDLAKRYARAYPALDSTDFNAPSLRLVSLVLDSGGIGTPSVAHAIRNASRGALFRAGLEHLGWWPDSAETAVSLLRELARGGHAVTGSDGGTAPWVADSLMWPQYVATALAFRGHLREAYATDRRLLLDPAASPHSWFVDPYLSLTLLGVIPDSVAQAEFSRSLEPSASWQSFTPRYLRGLPWWLARGDTASLARFAGRAAQVTRQPGTPEVGLTARLLGATATGYLALARGDSTEAERRLAAIPDTVCVAEGAARTCFYMKLTLARLLAARGEYGRAHDLLDRWRWGTGGPLFTIATLELGRIAERQGQREEAIESYRFVTHVWQRADPELQPYVTEARAALARLTGE
jgi:serine/threonine-protein kinase